MADIQKAYFIGGPYELNELTLHQERVESIIDELVEASEGKADRDDFTVTEVALDFVRP